MPRGSVVKGEEKVVGVIGDESGMPPVQGNGHNVVNSNRIVVIDDPLQPRGRSRLQRLTRLRKGWHQVWKDPEEIDDAKEIGYRFVREAVENEKAGDESGPCVTISRDDKIEMYLMEVEQWKFEQHLVAVSQASQARYGALKTQFRKTVEEVNVAVGGRNKEIRVNDSGNE